MMRVALFFKIRRDGGRQIIGRFVENLASSHYRHVVAMSRRRNIQDNTEGLGEANGWDGEGPCGMNADN